MKYVFRFYSNIGNYSSFGHNKIIPSIDQETMEAILILSKDYDKSIEPLWSKIKNIIYISSSQLNEYSSKFTDELVKGSYYLNGVTKEEIINIDKILKEKKIYLENTRILKKSEKNYEILIGSIEEKKTKLEINNNDLNITLNYGDFKDYLLKINNYLSLAKNYTSNDLQTKILDLYIDHFKTGDIETHRNSQKLWVKDISPIVEFNIGWVETYIDTFGKRAYYEGLVAIQDKDSSKKFKELVNNAEYLISTFPWSKDFEKDKFLSPDFTSLDVIGFATTNLFVGINLPNYTDIHETDGFKNVSLQNCYTKLQKDNIRQLLNEKDVNLFLEKGKKVSIFKTALHELLGHGSGKLFKKNANGEYNFDIKNLKNPLNGELINTFYEDKETFEIKFSTICRSLEECRADLTALYLCFDKKAQKIFEFDEKEYENVIYLMWLTQIYAGVMGVTYHKPNINKFSSPYAQERFVFVNYLIKNQDNNKKILDFEINETSTAFKIILNKDNLLNYGKKIVGEILKIIHIYKCIGDTENGNKFYEKYSEVDDYMSNIRRIFYYYSFVNTESMNIDLTMDDKENVEIKKYNNNIEDFIKSYVDRFGDEFNDITYKQWIKYQE